MSAITDVLASYYGSSDAMLASAQPSSSSMNEFKNAFNTQALNYSGVDSKALAQNAPSRSRAMGIQSANSPQEAQAFFDILSSDKVNDQTRLRALWMFTRGNADKFDQFKNFYNQQEGRSLAFEKVGNDLQFSVKSPYSNTPKSIKLPIDQWATFVNGSQQEVAQTTKQGKTTHQFYNSIKEYNAVLKAAKQAAASGATEAQMAPNSANATADMKAKIPEFSSKEQAVRFFDELSRPGVPAEDVQRALVALETKYGKTPEGKALLNLYNQQEGRQLSQGGADGKSLVITSPLNPDGKDTGFSANNKNIVNFAKDIEGSVQTYATYLNKAKNSEAPVATASKPAETKPLETKPVETKPIETKPAETREQKLTQNDSASAPIPKAPAPGASTSATIPQGEVQEINAELAKLSKLPSAPGKDNADKGKLKEAPNLPGSPEAPANPTEAARPVAPATRPEEAPNAPAPSAPESPSVPATPAAPEVKQYAIKAGDNFLAIADKLGATAENRTQVAKALMKLNPNVDPTAMQAGQNINVVDVETAMKMDASDQDALWAASDQEWRAISANQQPSVTWAQVRQAQQQSTAQIPTAPTDDVSVDDVSANKPNPEAAAPESVPKREEPLFYGPTATLTENNGVEEFDPWVLASLLDNFYASPTEEAPQNTVEPVMTA